MIGTARSAHHVLLALGVERTGDVNELNEGVFEWVPLADVPELIAKGADCRLRVAGRVAPSPSARRLGSLARTDRAAGDFSGVPCSTAGEDMDGTGLAWSGGGECHGLVHDGRWWPHLLGRATKGPGRALVVVAVAAVAMAPVIVVVATPVAAVVVIVTPTPVVFTIPAVFVPAHAISSFIYLRAVTQHPYPVQRITNAAVTASFPIHSIVATSSILRVNHEKNFM